MYRENPNRRRILAISSMIFLLLLASELGAQLFFLGPYRWRDNKGNCVNAVEGTIEGGRPERLEIPLKTISDEFLNSGSAYWYAEREEKKYVREELSLAEQEAFFRALQRALADTGKAKYYLRCNGCYTTYIGIPKGFDIPYGLRPSGSEKGC